MKAEANFLSRTIGLLSRVFAVLCGLFFLATPLLLSAATMDDYCLVPPYVKRDVKPNIMIIMDNSVSMGGPAYVSNYNPSSSYIGLFRPDTMYRYSSNRWLPDVTGIYSGKLLNWALTSRYDLLESILVGGKSTSRQTNINTLVGVTTSWTKTLTYTDSLGASRTCLFIVNNGNVEIKDDTAGSCGYLDTPAHPMTSALEPDTRYAHNSSPEDKEIAGSAMLGMFVRKGLNLLAYMMDIMASDAEAVSRNVRLPGGSGTLATGTECTVYTENITASESNSTAPYIWSITAGSLPPGLSLTSSGLTATISGNPTASGTYNFTLQVQDSSSPVLSDSKAYTITISDAGIAISTLTLPGGNVSVWYRETVSASGACTASTSWTLSAGSLPPGLSLQSGAVNHIDVAGTPTGAGTYNFTLRVTDSAANTATRAFTIVIGVAPPAGLQITTTSPLPNGLPSSYYQANVATFGSTCGGGCSTGWAWSIAAGSLPPGLSLNAAGPCLNGDHVYITGTPTTAGTYNFTVSATTPFGCGGTTTKAFSLTIDPLPATIRTTGNRNISICAGTTAVNCNTPGLGTTVTYNSLVSSTGSGEPCSASYPTGCVLKSGIVDEFWPQARFGLIDFGKVASVAVPDISKEIVVTSDPVPDSNFLTAVENAVPIDPITTLVNGEYTAVNYYKTDTGVNTDPFRSSQPCLKNFILMMTDGFGADNPPTPSGGTPNVFADATNCGSANYANLTKNGCYAYNNDLRTDAGRQYVSTYVVNTMGTPKTSGYDPNNAPATTGDILSQTAAKSGGSYYEVTDATQLKEQLKQAFQDIIKRAAAGTAASVLASGEGSGANLIQAVFYPRRKFGDDEIAWIGRLTNFWYYVDPFFGNSSIRQDDGDRILNLLADGSAANKKDYITELYFDAATEATKAKRYYDTNGDGLKDGAVPGADIEFETLGNLWEAGTELWKRSAARTVYTNCSIDSGSCLTDAGGNNTGLMNFSTANRTILRPYLQAANDDQAESVIRYIHGEDDSFVIGGTTYSYRTRKVKVDLNNDGDTLDTIGGIAEGTPRVWKLGDVLNSTPKISSWIPLNQFHRTYADTTYGDGSASGFINTSTYQNRGMVFAGANDGMLHAFKLGTLEQNWVGRLATEKARLTGSGFGEEVWAFVPKNALPYLTYQKEGNYCHVYTVDLTPYIFDASVQKPAACTETNYWNCTKAEESWRTILIGGMRYGGACRKTGSACTDCVKTPLDDPADPTHKGLGYSSYFALDITDQNSPKLLWEWDGTVLNSATGIYENHLGFSTTGPAIVKIKARNISGSVSVADKTKNGRWFVVLGSGPTGPVGTGQQFMGSSDQTARLFFIDLKNGPTSGNFWEYTSPVNNAFIGSLLNANEDVDFDYQDDAVYIPYVYKPAAGTTWTSGGVARILTNEDLDGTDLSGSGTGNTALNPANWTTQGVIDGIGPVTSSVARLQNARKGQLWLFFGSGRYYFEQGANTDDATGQRRIFGMKDPCFSGTGFTAGCSTNRTLSDLTDVTDIANVPSNPDAAGYEGWYINLDLSGNYAYLEGGTAITRAYRAERVITDPLATTSGLVFYTTYKPYNDECALGGKSFIWATKYDTGGAPGALLKGKALVQVSTGSIEQVDLATAFTEGGGRKSYSMEGVPPTAQGLSILSTPPPVKRTLHIRER